ncbi:replication factor C subunit 1 [Anoplophora glabripennis]|uniref:replication factor C subunit 1 n=1 Tax=Anoplophora glabripennis TaxID=217634 RepID=UPI0008746EF8|nr:replication factor C subunit 1 [Anoplophora glabripennis]
MSRDIRSFFNVISKKSNVNSSRPQEIKPKKSKLTIIDSDDDDIIESTPEQSHSKVSVTKRKVIAINSDSDEDSKHKVKTPKKSKTKNTGKLKPVNIDDVFGNTPIKQSKVEAVPVIKESVEKKQKKNRKPKTEIGVHNDEDFEKTLLELDDEVLIQNADILDKTIERALHKDVPNVKNTPTKEKSKHEGEKKRQRRSSSEGTPHKKAKLEHSDSGIDPDQEAFERKRYSAMLYQKYKNRGGPKHHGEKEIPQGKPDCLKNLTFLRTGVLDSLESNEFENLVNEHGGRVVHAVSKKVNYIVVGDDPGPSKLDKARGFNIPEISEDDLLDMILVKSGMKPKFSKTKSDVSSESGIATEDEISPKSRKKAKSPESKILKEGKEMIKHETSIKKEEKLARKTDNKLNFNQLSDVKTSSNNDMHKSKDEKVLVKEELHSPKSKLQSSKNVKSEVKSENLSQKGFAKIEIPNSALTWTEKYKPKDIKSIIGQQGDNSNMNKLKKWLQNWYRNQQPEVRKKIPRPSPWAKNDDGAYYKAALLSGPPGVGKTTTATLISKELGFDVVEFNASDTRSKRLLHEEVAQLLSTNTIAGFAAGKKTTDKKRVLLMDEVDGMAGNEDRGGIQELINLIKSTHIPVICMCNDRNHQKMRSLVNYCFDLRFNKPRAEQIRGAMMSICFKEGINISPNALTELIQGAGCDIRQTLNHLSMWSAADKNLSPEMVRKEAKAAKKDTVLGPWEVVKLVFSKDEQKNMSLSDKLRLFFYDYSLGPLFVQENYLNVTPSCDSKEFMKRASLAADAISVGDIIDSRIRSGNNWALLETQAIFSSVLPGFYMSGNVTSRINFPGWLGKNSSANKHKRMLCELHAHTRTSTSGNRMALKLDYLVPLRNAVITPLRKYGTDGVHQAIEVMKSYNLLREDLNNLIELCQWKNLKNPFNDIDAKVKSAFTRIYNKEAPLLPFAAHTGVSKKKAAAVETDLLDDEEFVESDQEENDDVTADAMIKVKTNSKGKKEPKASTSKAKTTSKATKGKGKKPK